MRLRMGLRRCEVGVVIWFSIGTGADLVWGKSGSGAGGTIMYGRSLWRPFYVRPRSEGGILTLTVRVTDIAQPEGEHQSVSEIKCRE